MNEPLPTTSLHPGLIFHRPIPGDPATLLNFVSELGGEAHAKQALGAYIQFSTKVLTAQIEFNNALLKAVS